MLTIADIPDAYRKGKTDGENIARLASGVQHDLGRPGYEAGLRFVQAGFQFRSAEIGRGMTSRSAALSSSLEETTQLVEFAGSVLAATSLAAAIDLTAAALHRLYLGPISTKDPAREADLENFGSREADLPLSARSWLEETRQARQWRSLKGVRDHLVHRWLPIHVTISPGGAPGVAQQMEIEGERHSLVQFLDDSRVFVVDRLVAAG